MGRSASGRRPRSPVLVLALLVVTWSATLPALSQEFSQLTLDPDRGPVGETVTATGDGFDRSTDVMLEFDGLVVATVAADGAAWTDADSFRTTFTVPDRPADPSGAGYDVVARQDGEPRARDVFSIVPTLTIDPTRGPGGSSAALSGTGWDPDEPLTIDFPAGSPLTTLEPGDPEWSGNSRFAVTITVPMLRADTHEVQAHQFERKLEQEVPFTVVPTLTVDPTSGRVGDTVDASATGFTDGFPVELRFDGELVGTVPAGGAAWTGTTTFETPFDVPDRPDGPYTVEARQDCDGGCDIRATARFTVTPVSLQLDPSEGPIGTTVEARGGGWDPDLPVTLTFDADPVGTVGSGEVDAAGTFITTFTVPDHVAGPVDVVACQRCGTAREVAARAPFEVLAVLTVDPAIGTVDSITTVHGEAFDDDLAVTLVFDGEVIETLPAPEAGFTDEVRFAAELTVPDRAAGTYAVQTCQRCGTPDEVRAEAAFTVIPSLAFQPALGPPGFVTVAVGRGFPTGEPVELIWDPGVGRRVLTADPDGTFRIPFLVHHRDATGPRSGRGVLPANEGRAPGDLIPEPEAPFLVVPGSLQPSDFVTRR